jgi:hypothetical protein
MGCWRRSRVISLRFTVIEQSIKIASEKFDARFEETQREPVRPSSLATVGWLDGLVCKFDYTFKKVPPQQNRFCSLRSARARAIVVQTTSGSVHVKMETVQQDTGLQCLALLLRFHQVSADPAQIAHQFSGAPIGVSEMQRCAKQIKKVVELSQDLIKTRNRQVDIGYLVSPLLRYRHESLRKRRSFSFA